jgi:hypothetical protein
MGGRQAFSGLAAAARVSNQLCTAVGEPPTGAAVATGAGPLSSA